MRVGMSAVGFNREGGIERASLELARALTDTGVDVTLIADHVDPGVTRGMTHLEVAVPPIPSFARPFVYPRRASRAVRGQRFDILHDQGATALMAQDVITAHSCHRAWWEIKRQTGQSLQAFLNPLHAAILATERHNYTSGSFSRVIAVSAGVGAELTRWYGVPPERIRVVPNAVDADRFGGESSRAARGAVRARHGIDDDAFVLVFVGKEFRRKGLGAAIDALSALPHRAVLLVVGGDDQQPFRAQAVQAGVGDRAVFAGHTTRVEDYFAAADAFVFPTLYEAFALVSLEAAASGLPLLTTRVNGTEDFVRPGENGFFVERDGASIAATAQRLIDDPALTARLGDTAQRDARTYTWPRMAALTRDVYDEVLEERRHHRT